MKRQNHLFLSGTALVAVIGLALTAPWGATAKARSISMSGGEVSVSVSFSTQMPLADTTDQTLAGTQKRGRTFVYRMARGECAVLKAVLAETCRLASLNVSSRLNNHSNNQPVTLHLNGNARYLITLKKF